MATPPFPFIPTTAPALGFFHTPAYAPCPFPSAASYQHPFPFGFSPTSAYAPPAPVFPPTPNVFGAPTMVPFGASTTTTSSPTTFGRFSSESCCPTSEATPIPTNTEPNWPPLPHQQTDAVLPPPASAQPWAASSPRTGLEPMRFFPSEPPRERTSPTPTSTPRDGDLGFPNSNSSHVTSTGLFLGSALFGSTSHAHVFGNTAASSTATTATASTPSALICPARSNTVINRVKEAAKDTMIHQASAPVQAEEAVRGHLAREIVSIQSRLQQQEHSLQSIQSEVANLSKKVAQIGISLGMHIQDGNIDSQASCFGTQREVQCSEMPQHYGFHNLNRQSLFRADGTEHSYFTLPADYEHATSPVSPSAGENVDVTARLSIGAQATRLASVLCSKANNTAGSVSLLVSNLQLPMNVQDAPHVFKETPVYDIYEEQDSACLDTASDVRDFSLELWCPSWYNAASKAVSKEATDFTLPHDPIIHADRSIKLTNEKSTHAASILCHEAIVHCHDERSEINIKTQDVLTNKHDITSPCDLHNGKEVPFVLLYQLPQSSVPYIFDPGILNQMDMMLVLSARFNRSTKSHLADRELMANTSTKVSALTWYKSLPGTLFILLGSTTYTWDPGVYILLHSYTATHPIGTRQGIFTQVLQPIFASAIKCSYAFGLGWTEVNASVLFVLDVPCFKSTSRAKRSLVLSSDGNNRTSHSILNLFLQSLCATTAVQVTDCMQYIASNGINHVLHATALIMQSAPHLFQGNYLCFLYCNSVLQIEYQGMRYVWVFSLEKGRQVQWDPGIEFILYELWWLRKGTRYVLRHLLAVKFGTHNYTCFNDTAASMCCPPANLIQQTNIAALLQFCHCILLSSDVCVWDPGIAFVYRKGVQKNYSAKNLLFSEKYLRTWEIYIIFITFLPP